METAWNATNGIETRSKVGKKVRVTCEDNTCVEGYLYAVDPEFGDVALVEVGDGSGPPGGGGDDGNKKTDGRCPMDTTTCVVMGHAVRQIHVMEEEETCPFDLWNEKNKEECHDVDWDPEVLKERKEHVQEMLHKHGLPFQDAEGNDAREDGLAPKSIQVLGCLLIHPPYTEHTCESSNELVLTKIRTMIAQNMPPLPFITRAREEMP